MNNKTLAIIAYLTIIGWIIAYIQYKDKTERNPLVKYHLEQALGVFIFGILLSIAITIIAYMVPAIAAVLSFVSFVPLILLIFGMIAAANEARSPVPVIGKLFEHKFSFLG